MPGLGFAMRLGLTGAVTVPTPAPSPTPTPTPLPAGFALNGSTNPALKAMLARVKAGTGSGKIVVKGDSTSHVSGGVVGPTQTTDVVAQALDARRYRPSAVSAALLTAAGYPAYDQDVTGDCGLHTQIAPERFDPRISYPGGGAWAYQGGGAFAGGDLMAPSGDIREFALPSVDTFEIIAYTVGGEIAVALDGAAAAGLAAPGCTITQGFRVAIPATNAGFVRIIATAASLGTHRVGIATTAGSPLIRSIRGYNSAAPGIQFIVHASAGATSGDQATASGNANAWANMDALAYDAPDLTLVKLGLNDLNQGIALATYSANLQAIIATAKQSGDVLVVSENAANPATFKPTATEDTYHAAAAQVAAQAGVAYCDIRAKFGVDVARLADNTVHPNRQYLADIAAYEVACIMAMAA